MTAGPNPEGKVGDLTELQADPDVRITDAIGDQRRSKLEAKIGEPAVGRIVGVEGEDEVAAKVDKEAIEGIARASEMAQQCLVAATGGIRLILVVEVPGRAPGPHGLRAALQDL